MFVLSDEKLQNFLPVISILAPSRGRPDKCFDTINKWIDKAGAAEIEVIISLDEDDPEFKNYQRLFAGRDYSKCRYYGQQNKSAVDAINNAATSALGDMFIVVSDDTECFNSWAYALKEQTNDKIDFILKTQDGIQPWIITMPIMDRVYYNRFGYIYHPDYLHLFCDTELTCVADITGRKITSNLLFPHKHYSVTKEQPDETNKKADATWAQGEKLFLERYKRNFDLPPGKPIEDNAMMNWLKRKVR